ncbi:hypothetical protein CCP3SC15_60017 [Gammaproteobacteria bacterium]
MTNSQPRASRPSAIRRRPQPAQSVDDFIQAGTGSDAPVEGTSVSVASAPAAPLPEPPAPTRPKGEGKTYFALLLGLCALGVALFDSYRLMWEPLAQEVQSGVQAGAPHVIPLVAPPGAPQETVRTEGGSSSPTSVSPTAESASPPTGIQGVQWLALTDLQFARHDLLLGLNTSAMSSLVLAKVHLSLLGKPFAAETTALDRIISRLQNAPALSLGQLDHDIETLKEAWLRVTFGPALQANEGLLDWLTPWHRPIRQEGRSELETTDMGRYLVARLDRLKWLALWGDERGLRQASATLEALLGQQFMKSPEAKPWLLWIRGLQRTPLRHDVTELNTLIVRLSRLELPP